MSSEKDPEQILKSVMDDTNVALRVILTAVPVKTNATRGAAGTAGRIIFNSDDGNLNIDDGTNWILPDGTTT